MKKTFNFGEFEIEGYFDERLHKITVEIEYEQHAQGANKPVFSATGEIEDCMGGQCLEFISEYVNDPTFITILNLWQEYHNNHLQEGCEHQREQEWDQLAKKEITKKDWCQTPEARKAIASYETMALNALKRGKVFAPTKHQTFMANLPREITTYNEQTPQTELQPYFAIYNETTVTATEVYNKEHPDGILLKPCPECNYKYGSKWLYKPIPKEAQKEILDLFID